MSRKFDSCEKVQVWAWKGFLHCVRVQRECRQGETDMELGENTEVAETLSVMPEG